jgi:hypothetical protein
MAASGTTKKVTVNQILGSGGTATLASATITGDLTVDTNVLKVDTSNNRVGINQAVPLYPLDATGGFSNLVARLLRVGDYGEVIRIGRSGVSESASINYPADNTFAINTVSTERYRIDSNGVATWSNVGGVAGTAMTLNSTGLGVGVSPAQKLDVDGNIRMSGVSGGTRFLLLNADNTYTGSLTIQSGGGSASYGAATILYGNSHATYPGGVWIGRSSGSTGPIMFGTGGVTPSTIQMTLDASGRLLIGTVTSGTAAGDGVVKLGTYGHCISQTGTSIASGSSVDLTVVTSGAGYQGFLSVANTLDGNANSRTQTTYSVFGRGTSSTITQIATANGSTSGASFTVTTPSNGVIRITNTSGNIATISAQFFGGSSA